MKRKIVSLGILLTALALTGCAKKNKVTESTTEVVELSIKLRLAWMLSELENCKVLRKILKTVKSC